MAASVLRRIGHDEGELETAGEEAQHKQHVAPVAEGFDERLTRRLRPCGCGSRCRLRRRKREGQRQHQKDRSGKDEQRGLPGERMDQRGREWRIEELAERAEMQNFCGGRSAAEQNELDNLRTLYPDLPLDPDDPLTEEFEAWLRAAAKNAAASKLDRSRPRLSAPLGRSPMTISREILLVLQPAQARRSN